MISQAIITRGSFYNMALGRSKGTFFDMIINELIIIHFFIQKKRHLSY